MSEQPKFEGHTGILGQSGTGKSYMGKQLAAGLLALRPVFVLNPIGDKWPCTWQTYDTAKFVSHCKKKENIDGVVFVDEAREAFENGDVDWLALRGRHLGHGCFFIGQRYTHMPPDVRYQCACWYIFNLYPDDAEVMARNVGEKAILEAPTLKVGEFFRKRRLKPIERGIINFEAGTVDIWTIGEKSHDARTNRKADDAAGDRVPRKHAQPGQPRHRQGAT